MKRLLLICFGLFLAVACHAVTVNPPLTIIPPATSCNNVTVGDAYTCQITPNGGTKPYSYKLTSGAFPSGIALDPSSGLISGTPAAGSAGSYTPTITVTDSGVPALTATVTVDPHVHPRRAGAR